MIGAVQDGCDIINLSPGGGDEDEAIRGAIGSELDNGVLVIAAAGNDGPVSCHFGRESWLPEQARNIMKP
ncbi:S8 family serine peptidase [Rhizobium leguminosarum]|uniref:S8 family serine peptidase n=1 Tax=Rhizobium leguminosarum TaxID=384 RepID=UPI001C900C3E|nr:S8 family serine peptidase [Rhizobium leguminosarum]